MRFGLGQTVVYANEETDSVKYGPCTVVNIEYDYLYKLKNKDGRYCYGSDKVGNSNYVVAYDPTIPIWELT